MADFAAVLKKTLEQMGETSPEARGKVYDKARETVRRQIDAMEKTPPQAAIDRQFAKLEEAIDSVETEYVSRDETRELDSLLDEVATEIPADTLDADQGLADPDPEVDPDIAREADVEPMADLDAETPVEPKAEPAPMPTPDEVVAEVTNVSPEEVAQYAAEGELSNQEPAATPVDPLAEFINEHSASTEDANSVDAAAEDLKSATSMPTDDVLGEITPERETDPAIVNDAADGMGAGAATKEKSGGAGRWIAILVILGVLGGGGYYAYATQPEVKTWWDQTMLPLWEDVTGGSETSQSDESGAQNAESESNGDVPVRTVTTTTVDSDDVGEGDDATAEDDTTPPEEEVAAVDPEDLTPKFTQRLMEDGTEVDEVPAQTADAGVDVAGGSSVAEQSNTPEDSTTDQTTSGEEDATVVVPEAPAVSDGVGTTPVGQRAIFYEERTGSQEGTALAGATIWSVVNESPGGDLPVEPAIRAETTIPELGIEMEMTIRRNGDKTFPASHIVELFFTVPDTFEGRGIADVQRVTFKTVEQDPGNALIAVPAPIDQNIFMIALTDAATAVDTNVNLMKRENWIDIPMQYTSGRRALITFEKGIPGERVFNEVFAAWDAAPIN